MFGKVFILKKQARHVVYVEKLQNEDIYKFICKTTKRKHLNKCNMEVKIKAKIPGG